MSVEDIERQLLFFKDSLAYPQNKVKIVLVPDYVKVTLTENQMGIEKVLDYNTMKRVLPNNMFKCLMLLNSGGLNQEVLSLLEANVGQEPDCCVDDLVKHLTDNVLNLNLWYRLGIQEALLNKETFDEQDAEEYEDLRSASPESPNYNYDVYKCFKSMLFDVCEFTREMKSTEQCIEKFMYDKLLHVNPCNKILFLSIPSTNNSCDEDGKIDCSSLNLFVQNVLKCCLRKADIYHSEQAVASLQLFHCYLEMLRLRKHDN